MYLANLAKLFTNLNANEGVTCNMQVNMFEAKSDLSKLVNLLEKKKEKTITIARNGKPVACLTLYEPQTKRIGIAEGKTLYKNDFDAHNDEISKLFGV